MSDDDVGYDFFGKADDYVDRMPEEIPPAEEDKQPRKSAAQQLVDLANQRYVFAATTDGEPYALVRNPRGHVVRMLRGGQVSLRAELAATYQQQHRKVAGQQALADAMLALEGAALHPDQPRGDAHLRLTSDETGTVWVDVGDAHEHAVRIDAAGWEVVSTDVPVRFRRSKLTGALPMPVRGGSVAELWELLNVAPADRPLVLGWLVAALVAPDIPHPILALFGEQGTGKSTASRLLAQLVDPSPVPLRKPPRDAEGWVTAAAGSWVVGLDNLSTVQDWFSDSLCRAATGDGDVRRALYTDGGLAVFAFRRVILLNGIDVGALRGDLADRALAINLDRLREHQRVTESQLNRRWREAYPRILGALLTEGCEALRILPSVRLGSSPRMADFAVILAALDQRHGTDGLGRYAGQARTMAEDSLDSDPFLLAMREHLTAPFTGTAADLLDRLTPIEQGWRAPRDWPKNARSVTGILKRNAPSLRKAGWTVDDAGLDPEARVIRWSLSRPEIARNPSSGSSGSSKAQVSTVQENEDSAEGWHDDGHILGGTPGGETAGQSVDAEEPRITRNETGPSQDDLWSLQTGCVHGVDKGDQPDPFVGGYLRCSKCRAEAMAS